MMNCVCSHTKAYMHVSVHTGKAHSVT